MNREKRFRRFGYFVLYVSIAYFSRCASAPAIKPPLFDYQDLVRRYFITNPGGHLPLTVEEGANLFPCTWSHYLFYTTTKNGSRDIWMRDLDNTVNVPLIQHASDQYAPTLDASGKRIVFVSEDSDTAGDLYIANLDPAPAQIVENTLQGISPPNFWVASRNLSTDIEALARTMPSACRGGASEKDPVWSPDGKHLYYTSDRCSPGKENIWMVEIGENRILRPPVEITHNGGVQPSLSPDGNALVYVSFSDDSRHARIHTMDLKTGTDHPVETDTEEDRIDLRPGYSQDGQNIYYYSIRRDSNGDGHIDFNDAAGIYERSLAHPDRERQLLEDGAPLFGLIVSSFAGGSLLYAAEQNGSINIYLMRKEGIIPIRDDIEEQYELTKKYVSESIGRYLLSLETLQDLFQSNPAYPVYEARSIADENSRYTRNGTAPPDWQKTLRQKKEKNPFADLLLRLRASGLNAGQNTIAIQDFLKRLDQESNQAYSPASLVQVRGAAMELLARSLLQQHKPQEALRVIEKLNTAYPEYHLRRETLFLQGSIALELNRSIPDVLERLLADRSTPFEMRERILSKIYSFYTENLTPSEAKTAIEQELKEGGIQPEIRSDLLLARSRILFNENQFQPARDTAMQATEGVPRDSGIFVRGMQILAEVYEKYDHWNQAYDARMVMGGSFRQETGIKLSLSDFQDIIDESDRNIRIYVRSARSISKKIHDAIPEKSPVISPVLLANETRIPFDGPDRDFMAIFCSEESRSRDLISRSGQPRYVLQYRELCDRNNDYFRGKSQTPPLMSDAESAADLLYLTSYINANLLNILFLNIKKSGQFESLYRSRSVFYHKLKIDIAMERNREKLEREKEKVILLNPEEIRDLVVTRDPFDASTFNELVHGYKLASDEARKTGDLSIMYGYAYTLIHKSVEREKFYDSIIEKGADLPPDVLKEKKETILRDLKNAEYQLQYILYTDPVYSDAYLLLGWMYQYIDERRSRPIMRKRGIAERFVNFVTGTRPHTPTDGRTYRDLYRVYFPDHLYESNISLYRKAIRLVNPRIAHAGELAGLHLNLANNYFKLMNFKNAVEQYDAVESILQNSGQFVFENHTREALYRFNRGRALFYEGRSARATEQLQQAFDIYDETERKPTQEQYSTVLFRLKLMGTPGSTNVEKTAILLERQKKFLESRLREIRYRMALILMLKGLAHADAGNFDLAIQSYRQADIILYDSGSIPSNAPDRSGLLNFIALAYQSKGDYRRSDKNAVQASEIARKEGLKRNDERYQPETIGGKLLGLLIHYGEDFSVNGEGRTPYGFSSLRQYELSLGIRLENRIMRGDLRGALQLIQLRQKVFEKRDGDVLLGKLGSIASINQEASSYYSSRDYLKAAQLFKMAAERARDDQRLSRFRVNITNYFYSLFSYFESARPTDQKVFSLLEDAEKEFVSFRKDYREQVRKTYIKRKSTESPDFSYEPDRDDPKIDAQTNRELADMIAIEGSIHYYRGTFLDQSAKDEEGIKKSRIEFMRSIKIFNHSVSLFSDNKDTEGIRYLRAMLNRSRARLAYGDLYGAKRDLNRISDIAYEYNLLLEQWETNVLLAATEEKIAGYGGSSRDRGDALVHVQKSLDLLRSHPELIQDLKQRIPGLYDLATHLYILNGDTDGALALQEEKRRVRLFGEFLNYPLTFKDASFSNDLRLYRNSLHDLRQLDLDESDARLRHSGLKEIQSDAARIRQQSELIRSRILEKSGDLYPFLGSSDPSVLKRPRLARGQILLRLFSNGDVVYAWLFRENRTVFLSTAISRSRASALQELLHTILSKAPDARELFLIHDPNLFDLPVESYIRQSNSNLRITLATRMDDDMIGFIDDPARAEAAPRSRNIYNIMNFNILDTPVRVDEAADVVEFRMNTELGPFGIPGKNEFNARYWIQENRTTSVAIVDTGKSDGHYEQFADLYEILRSRGIGTMILVHSDDERDAALSIRGEKPYSSTGLRVFGCDGFERHRVRSILGQLQSEATQTGEEKESKGNFTGAIKSYRLASSYLWKRKDDSADSFNNTIKLARATMLLSGGRSGSNILRQMIKDYRSPRQAARLAISYRTLIETFYRTGHATEARKYVAQFASDFPSEKVGIERESSVLSFVARIDARSYRDASGSGPGDFNGEFNHFYPDLLLFPKAAKVGDALLRHARHSEAERLARGWIADANRKKDGLALLVLSKMDSWILDGAPVPRFTDAEIPSRLQPILTAAGRNRDDYRTMLDALLKSEDPVVRTYRMELYGLWRLYLRDELPGIRNLEDTTFGKDLTLYTSLPLIERSMVFRMLVDFIPKDPSLQSARYLDRLIQVEFNSFSPDRAAQMARIASRQFLKIGDASTAEHFLLRYESYNNEIIPYPEQDRDEAVTGLLLEHVAGFKHGSQNVRWARVSGEQGDVHLLSLLGSIAYIRQSWDFRPLNDFLNQLQKETIDQNDPIYDELQSGIALLRQAALSEQRWETAFNITVLQQNIDNFMTANRIGLPSRTLRLRYTDYAGQIRTSLPPGQRFLTLIDGGEAAFRLILTRDKSTADPFSVGGRYMRGRMYEMLARLRATEPTGDIMTEVQGLYRSLFGYGNTSVTYFWFHGIHSLAPLFPDRGDRIFQIMNLDLFMERKTANLSGAFQKEFSVHVMGDSSRSQIENKGEGQDGSWIRTTRTMERVSLDETDNGRESPLHIMQSVQLDKPSSLFALLQLYEKAGPDVPWFLSGDLGDENTSGFVSEYNLFLYMLGNYTTSPGIITMQLPGGLAHSYFVRNYYSRSTPTGEIQGRYSRAYLKLIRKFGEKRSLYGYRLATPVPVAESGKEN